MTLIIKPPSVRELIGSALSKGQSVEEIMERFQHSVIVYALEQTKGNISQAAALLKTHRNNLIRWMHEAGIDKHFPDTEEL